MPILTGAELTVTIAIIETLGELIKSLVIHTLAPTSTEQTVSVASIEGFEKSSQTATDTYASTDKYKSKMNLTTIGTLRTACYTSNNLYANTNGYSSGNDYIDH